MRYLFLSITIIICTVTILYSVDSDYISIQSALKSKYENSDIFFDKNKIFFSNQTLNTDEKKIALTFDACGGGYNKALIEFLVKNNIKATLFVSGKWIDSNRDEFIKLCKNNLFEIENHGLLHRTVVISEKSIYGVKSVQSIAELVDEVELNARKIAEYNGFKPKYYRSATGWYSKIAIQIINDLGYVVLNGNSAAFDYDDKVSAAEMVRNILKTENPSIIVFHMNHPEWQELEAVKRIYKYFIEKGYSFVKVSEHGVR